MLRRYLQFHLPDTTVVCDDHLDIAVEWQACFKVASLLLYPDSG